MGNRCVIVGAGGFGREVYTWLSQSPRFREEHAIDSTVFVDDSDVNSSLTEVVGTFNAFVPSENDLVCIAVGDPATRRTIANSLEERGARFLTFVDDRAVIGTEVTIGVGSIVCPGTVVTTNVGIGEHVHINLNCSIGHDATIGSFATVSPLCNVQGDVVLENEVFLGGSASVIRGNFVGSGAVIGAGAVVTKAIPAGTVAVGNPARPR